MNDTCAEKFVWHYNDESFYCERPEVHENNHMSVVPRPCAWCQGMDLHGTDCPFPNVFDDACPEYYVKVYWRNKKGFVVDFGPEAPYPTALVYHNVRPEKPKVTP